MVTTALLCAPNCKPLVGLDSWIEKVLSGSTRVLFVMLTENVLEITFGGKNKVPFVAR